MGEESFYSYGTYVYGQSGAESLVSVLDGTFFMPFSFKVPDTSYWAGRTVLP